MHFRNQNKSLKYHQKNVYLLNIIPNLKNHCSWEDWAKENKIKLPESFTEWFRIKEAKDILYKYCNSKSTKHVTYRVDVILYLSYCPYVFQETF